MCVTRRHMPQVADDKLPDLLDWLAKRGIAAYWTWLPTHVVRHRQCPDLFDPAYFVGKADGVQRNKPILVSRDLCIVDGNHRHEDHNRRGLSRIYSIILDAPFNMAVEAVREFPGSYTNEEHWPPSGRSGNDAR